MERLPIFQLGLLRLVEVAPQQFEDSGLLRKLCFRSSTAITTDINRARFKCWPFWMKWPIWTQHPKQSKCSTTATSTSFGGMFPVGRTRRAAPRDQRAREDLTTLSEFRGPTNGYRCYFYELLGDSPENLRCCVTRMEILGLQWIFWNKCPVFRFGRIHRWRIYVTGLNQDPITNPKRFERENGRVVLLSLWRVGNLSFLWRFMWVVKPRSWEGDQSATRFNSSEILEFAPKIFQLLKLL